MLKKERSQISQPYCFIWYLPATDPCLSTKESERCLTRKSCSWPSEMSVGINRRSGLSRTIIAPVFVLWVLLVHQTFREKKNPDNTTYYPMVGHYSSSSSFKQDKVMTQCSLGTKKQVQPQFSTVVGFISTWTPLGGGRASAKLHLGWTILI